MSKAFTSDSDEEGDLLDGPTLPPGVRHYMTVHGAQRLRAEVQRLTDERQHVSPGMEGKARAQKIERQLRYWLPRLEVLEEIDPLTQPTDRVLFGATVTIEEAGKSEDWRIVGLDETDLDRGWISWMSPLAVALLDHRVGDSILFMGRRLTLVRLIYEA